jgi:hypothetical protein
MLCARLSPTISISRERGESSTREAARPVICCKNFAEEFLKPCVALGTPTSVPRKKGACDIDVTQDIGAETPPKKS